MNVVFPVPPFAEKNDMTRIKPPLLSFATQRKVKFSILQAKRVWLIKKPRQTNAGAVLSNFGGQTGLIPVLFFLVFLVTLPLKMIPIHQLILRKHWRVTVDHIFAEVHDVAGNGKTLRLR